MGVPDAPHTGFADARCPCHSSRRPMCVALVGFSCSVISTIFFTSRLRWCAACPAAAHPSQGQRSCRPESGSAIAPPSPESSASFGRSGCFPSPRAANSTIRACSTRHRQRALPRHTLQRCLLLEAQFNRGGYAHTVSSTVWTKLVNNRYYLRRITLGYLFGCHPSSLRALLASPSRVSTSVGR